MRAGVVEDFDEAKGWGTVRDADEGVHFLHCTTIADGTRTIAVGTAVRYRLVPGRLGRYEAAEITPAS